MKLRSIYVILLEATVVGLCVGIFMAYIALDHNPQDEFFDFESRKIVVDNLLSMMLTWVLVCGASYAVVRALVTWWIAIAGR